MKAHYNGQKLLLQVLLFEITCFKTSTKLILKGFFANGTSNKIVQNPNDKIVKKNPIWVHS